MKTRACVLNSWLPAFALAFALAGGCDEDDHDQDRSETNDAATTPIRVQDASERTRQHITPAPPDSGLPLEVTDSAVPPAEGCVEVQTWPEMNSTSYYRTSWDEGLRIETRESSSTADFATRGETLRWRYSEDGRVLAYAGDNFQHDYSYDEHDNVIDFRLTYPDAPDVTKPSQASVWIGHSSDNKYDESGRLSSSVGTEYGAGLSNPRTRRRTYQEENGRCASIVTVDEGEHATTETREYDERGVLTNVDVSSEQSSDHDGGTDEPIGFCGNSQRTLVYRDGMLESDTTLCSAGGGFSRTYSHLPDGSLKIERYDGLTDVPSERNSTLVRSAACLEIDAAIGVRDAHCHAP